MNCFQRAFVLAFKSNPKPTALKFSADGATLVVAPSLAGD
jgi:hypothetical protein